MHVLYTLVGLVAREGGGFVTYTREKDADLKCVNNRPSTLVERSYLAAIAGLNGGSVAHNTDNFGCEADHLTAVLAQVLGVDASCWISVFDLGYNE